VEKTKYFTGCDLIELMNFFFSFFFFYFFFFFFFSLLPSVFGPHWCLFSESLSLLPVLCYPEPASTYFFLDIIYPAPLLPTSTFRCFFGSPKFNPNVSFFTVLACNMLYPAPLIYKSGLAMFLLVAQLSQL